MQTTGRHVAPNPFVIIAHYETLVAFLLTQREGQLALIEHLTGRVLTLQDLIGPNRGKTIPCARCSNPFPRGGVRAKHCPTCRPLAKAEKDHARWIATGKTTRAAKRAAGLLPPYDPVKRQEAYARQFPSFAARRDA